MRRKQAMTAWMAEHGWKAILIAALLFYSSLLPRRYVGFFNDDARYILPAMSLGQGPYVALDDAECARTSRGSTAMAPPPSRRLGGLDRFDPYGSGDPIPQPYSGVCMDEALARFSAGVGDRPGDLGRRHGSQPVENRS